MFSNDIDIRSAIKYAKEKLNGDLLCAEIGVREGHHSRGILTELNVKHIYMVDDFKPYLDGEDYFEQERQDNHKRNLLELISTVEIFNKSTLLLQSSHNASKLFQENYLDFVYIDAAHDFYNVKHDLECWFPKVKVGGILSGHDFNIVQKAVYGFVQENNLECPQLIAFPDTDWLIVKTQPL